MKIAIVTESFLPDIGGITTTVVRQAEALLDRGHEPVVIAPAPASPWPVEAERCVPYPVVWVPSRQVSRSPASTRLRGARVGLPTPAIYGALAAYAPDVVYLVSPIVMGARGALDARRLGIPIVALYYTDPHVIAGPNRVADVTDWIWGKLCRIHGLADVNLAPTATTMRDLQDHNIPRVRLWNPGVDLRCFSPERRSERLRDALAPEGDLIVGYVGRLAAEKQIDLLADTARLPGVRLVVVGDGPDQARLRSLLPQAVFTGSRRGKALARLYAGMDVFVHPGGYETAGLTILEAQASGCAVIVPATGGASDLMQPDHSGVVVPSHDGASIADAVAKLAADRELLARMRTNALRYAARHGWQTSTDQLVEHFRAAAACH
ncbi:glycosyltransferase family 1 protein [Micromonospora sp. NPDC050686]|uniref:glycosyltransferase family 4 protein n=1 Tax=Micromonospora sp. NPDC050686 TaxID=3154631 RepID=UPI0033E3D7E2